MKLRKKVARRCGRPLGTVFLIATIVTTALAAPSVQALDLKIGIVNINRALNTSEAGERSKKILLASKTQKENELKAKDTAFRKLVDDSRSNMMLSESAKAAKEKELRDKDAELRQEVQTAQHDLQEQERKMTEVIFGELKIVVTQIAHEKKYDLVLEQAAAQVLLYSQLKLDDLTDDVIAQYNKNQVKKP